MRRGQVEAIVCTGADLPMGGAGRARHDFLMRILMAVQRHAGTELRIMARACRREESQTWNERTNAGYGMVRAC